MENILSKVPMMGLDKLTSEELKEQELSLKLQEQQYKAHQEAQAKRMEPTLRKKYPHVFTMTGDCWDKQDSPVFAAWYRVRDIKAERRRTSLGLYRDISTHTHWHKDVKRQRDCFDEILGPFYLEDADGGIFYWGSQQIGPRYKRVLRVSKKYKGSSEEEKQELKQQLREDIRLNLQCTR